eukprot:scaffold21180_cov31-Tisochrysis_lutea.AAC.7
MRQSTRQLWAVDVEGADLICPSKRRERGLSELSRADAVRSDSDGAEEAVRREIDGADDKLPTARCSGAPDKGVGRMPTWALAVRETSREADEALREVENLVGPHSKSRGWGGCSCAFSSFADCSASPKPAGTKRPSISLAVERVPVLGSNEPPRLRARCSAGRISHLRASSLVHGCRVADVNPADATHSVAIGANSSALGLNSATGVDTTSSFSGQ